MPWLTVGTWDIDRQRQAYGECGKIATLLLHGDFHPLHSPQSRRPASGRFQYGHGRSQDLLFVDSSVPGMLGLVALVGLARRPGRNTFRVG